MLYSGAKQTVLQKINKIALYSFLKTPHLSIKQTKWLFVEKVETIETYQILVGKVETDLNWVKQSLVLFCCVEKDETYRNFVEK